ncbi:MAG: Mut7-C RNAse domain-containing protein [Candidatus Bathyarchaeia archaeon]
MERLKFITDGMLGKLTRWLRMLGQDVEYSRSVDDKKLVEIAKKEHRTILTRDLKLYQQAMMQGVNAVLVEASTGPKKLADLARRFNFKLEVDVTVSRCPKCNTKIKHVPKDMVIDRVPKTTSTYYNEFWECPGCGQVYWQGAHWKRIEKTLEEAKKALEKL